MNSKSDDDGQSVDNLKTVVNELDENINKLKVEIDSLKVCCLFLYDYSYFKFNTSQYTILLNIII